jgi:hypothetical protein
MLEIPTCMHDTTPPLVHSPLSFNLTRIRSLRPLVLPVKCVLGWVSVCSSLHHMLTTCSARPNDRGAHFGTTRHQCFTTCMSQIPCVKHYCVPPQPHIQSRRGPSGGVPLTLLTPTTTDASKFRVFGCNVFAKVPYKSRRELGEKVLRGVMVGYSPYAPLYRVYNPVTRRISISVHVNFQEDNRGINTSTPIDFVIYGASNTTSDYDPSPQSHPHSHTGCRPPPYVPNAVRSHRLRSRPVRLRD